MKSKKKPIKNRSLFKEVEEGFEELKKTRKVVKDSNGGIVLNPEQYTPIDLKEWARWIKKTPSLMPPKWIQQGMTKEQWEKKDMPKKKRSKKNEN